MSAAMVLIGLAYLVSVLGACVVGFLVGRSEARLDRTYYEALIRESRKESLAAFAGAKQADAVEEMQKLAAAFPEPTR